MTRLLRSLAVIALLGVAGAASAVSILVAQTRPVGAASADENSFLLQILADKLDEDGRVKPIQWAQLDPIFRTAVISGQVRAPASPDLKDYLAGSEKLRCDYFLLVGFWKKDDQFHGYAKLYQKGKLVWQDPDPKAVPTVSAPKGAQPQAAAVDERDQSRIIQVAGSGENAFTDTLRSLAETWVAQLGLGPLKAHTPRPRIEDPGADRGTETTAAPPKPLSKIDTPALIAESMRMLAAGQGQAALIKVLDAVDENPLDPDRRRLLVEILLALHSSQEAAMQARLAAQVLPDRADLWTLAAKSWLRCGKSQEAQADLNEAIARDPNNPEVRLMMAQMALRNDRIQDALDHAAAALQQVSSPEGHFVLGLAQILRTGPDAGAKELELAKPLFDDLIKAGEAYSLAYDIAVSKTAAFGDRARALMVLARRDGGSQAVKSELAALLDTANRASAVMDCTAAPKLHDSSDRELRLALKLLSQSMSEVGSALSGDADALDDATIDLGEGLKKLKAAQAAHVQELEEGDRLGTRNRF